MSVYTYLNELETERLAIESEKPVTVAERAEWWERLAEWWRKRDLGFGDGAGMFAHCRNRAEQLRRECNANRQPATCADWN